jgi:NMT1/THI5 like
MRKYTWFRMSIASLAGIFALNAGGLARAERLTVRLDFIPVGFHAAMHLAKEKGWFAREGLEIEIQDGTGSLNTIQLVGSGQIDVGQVQLGVIDQVFCRICAQERPWRHRPPRFWNEDGEGSQRYEALVLHCQSVGAVHR